MTLYHQLHDPTVGDGVKLPFQAVYASWMNGDKREKEAGDIRYYGGWRVETAKLADELKPLPGTFKPFPFLTRSGTEVPSLGARLVTVAVVDSRSRWTNDTTRQYALKYFAGARQHVQWLCAMFAKPELTEFVPAVLTTKGWAATQMLEAVKEWGAAIRKHAPAHPYPVSAFAITVGTHGEAEFKPLGKAQAQSPGTPIRAVITDAVIKSGLEKRLLPLDTAKAVIEMRQSAAEWLRAWKVEYGDADGRANGNANGHGDALPYPDHDSDAF